jgi:multidrug resistance efflux pump
MAEASTAPTPINPNRRPLWNALIFGTLALVGVLVVLYAWNLPPFHSAVESTENATVQGQVTLISPQLSGYVVEVHVQDFQHVKAGQLMFQIDDRIYRQRLDQARAQVANAIAQEQRSAADLRRVQELAADGSLSVRELDAARATHQQTAAAVEQARAALEISRQNFRSVGVNRASLEAAVASAQAAVRLAEIDLSNTRIVAPRDGQLGQVSVREGAYANAGTALTALVPPVLWVIANMKETQMPNVRVGQPVTFTVDALGGARLHGKVERISPATGSEFSVLPPDNATGNFVKITQRIPVRISVDPNQQLAARLAPGMSVVVSIDTAAKGRQ